MSVIDVAWSEPAAIDFENLPTPLGLGVFSNSFQPFVAGSVDTIYTSHGFATSRDFNHIYLRSPNGLTTFWLHFGIKTAVSNVAEQGTTPINGIPTVKFYHNNQIQFRMGRGNASATNWYFNKTIDNGVNWTQVGTFAIVPAATLMLLDIKVVISATVGIYEIYKDGVLLTSFSGNTSSTDNAVSLIELGSGIELYSSSNNIYSQMILADENTIGFKVQTLKVLSDNTPGTFLGTFARVNASTYTPTSNLSVSSNTPDASIVFTVTDTIANSLTIDSVWTGARKRKVGPSAVTKSSFVLKIGATEYVDTPHNSTIGEEVAIKTKWSANPSNGSGWTNATVDALQIGCKVLA
jgi:hypothetical protein